MRIELEGLLEEVARVRREIGLATTELSKVADRTRRIRAQIRRGKKAQR